LMLKCLTPVIHSTMPNKLQGSLKKDATNLR
jgi:hypothetical protein